MTAKQRLFSSLLVSCIAFGCGGGGGGDETVQETSPTVFSGIYDISYQIVSNSCQNSSPLSSLREVYTIVSGYDAHGIPLNYGVSDNGLDLDGFYTAEQRDNFLLRSFSHELPGFMGNIYCSEILSVDIQQIDFEQKQVGKVVRTSDITCEFDPRFPIDCQVVYEGSGTLKSE